DRPGAGGDFAAMPDIGSEPADNDALAAPAALPLFNAFANVAVGVGVSAGADELERCAQTAIRTRNASTPALAPRITGSRVAATTRSFSDTMPTSTPLASSTGSRRTPCLLMRC